MYFNLVFLPLLGSFSCLIFGRFLGKFGASIVTTSLVFLSCFFSYIVFYEVALMNSSCFVFLNPWMSSGVFTPPWEFIFDTFTVVMLFVVTTIFLLVHLFSIFYMAEGFYVIRFLSFISFFMLRVSLNFYSFCNENILIFLKNFKKNFVCLNDFVLYKTKNFFSYLNFFRFLFVRFFVLVFYFLFNNALICDSLGEKVSFLFQVLGVIFVSLSASKLFNSTFLAHFKSQYNSLVELPSEIREFKLYLNERLISSNQFHEFYFSNLTNLAQINNKGQSDYFNSLAYNANLCHRQLLDNISQIKNILLALESRNVSSAQIAELRGLFNSHFVEQDRIIQDFASKFDGDVSRIRASLENVEPSLKLTIENLLNTTSIHIKDASVNASNTLNEKLNNVMEKVESSTSSQNALVSFNDGNGASGLPLGNQVSSSSLSYDKGFDKIRSDLSSGYTNFTAYPAINSTLTPAIFDSSFYQKFGRKALTENTSQVTTVLPKLLNGQGQGTYTIVIEMPSGVIKKFFKDSIEVQPTESIIKSILLKASQFF